MGIGKSVMTIHKVRYHRDNPRKHLNLNMKRRIEIGNLGETWIKDLESHSQVRNLEK